MKSVVKATGNGRYPMNREEMFDGTAAREIGSVGHVILVDRRSARPSLGDNCSRALSAGQNAAPSFGEDVKFALEALGVKHVMHEARVGSLAGRNIPGATPAAIAGITVAMAAIGAFIAVL